MENHPYFESEAPGRKPCIWLFDSLEVLRDSPDAVKDVIGHALDEAQAGRKASGAKPLTGDKAFKGGKVLEVVDDFDGDTYRAVYTVRFADALYVLHTFMKKSTTGRETPKHEIELIKRRLAFAEEHYRKHVALFTRGGKKGKRP
ncbi:MAG: type II toxin-antitoxin system RelE/ParE family toxin [Chloroflexi bacterium]|nr:type II toxin-antitoxin system RelE/ParE family toxin [Chloroflexota bacterium]